MEFTKMHGAGNDYILLNCMETFPTDPAELSRKLSDRHFGVGGDGIICICPSELPRKESRFYALSFAHDDPERTCDYHQLHDRHQS